MFPCRHIIFNCGFFQHGFYYPPDSILSICAYFPTICPPLSVQPTYPSCHSPFFFRAGPFGCFLDSANRNGNGNGNGMVAMPWNSKAQDYFKRFEQEEMQSRKTLTPKWGLWAIRSSGFSKTSNI